jgi:hypothetical protein
MTIESARAAVDNALTKALEGETAEVSPIEHGISASELSKIADEQMARRDATAKLDISFVAESREGDGPLLFRPSSSA